MILEHGLDVTGKEMSCTVNAERKVQQHGGASSCRKGTTLTTKGQHTGLHYADLSKLTHRNQGDPMIKNRIELGEDGADFVELRLRTRNNVNGHHCSRQCTNRNPRSDRVDDTAHDECMEDMEITRSLAG